MIVDFLVKFLYLFIHLLLTVTPYFLIGILFAAVLKTFIKEDWFYLLMGKGKAQIPIAAFWGALLPGCACATVPMAQGLKEKGLKSSAILTFIFISSLLSPITVLLTLKMLGIKFVAFRIIMPLLGSLLFGFLMEFYNYTEASKHKDIKDIKDIKEATRGNDAPPAKNKCVEDSCCNSAIPQSILVIKNFFLSFKEIFPHFTVGIGMAALMITFIPENALAELLGGKSGLWAYLLAVLIGIPMYVCEGEEVPITYALLKAGLGQGPSFSFLLGSVGVCLPSFFMTIKVVGKKEAVLYLMFWVVFAFFSGVIFDNIF